MKAIPSFVILGVCFAAFVMRADEESAALRAKPAAGAKTEAAQSGATATEVAFIHEELENLKTQLRLYEIRNGSLPSTEQGLKALVERPNDQPIPHRWRRLLADVPKDPWDHEYRLEVPATHSRDAFDVFSAGPDGKFGTADDIGNW